MTRDIAQAMRALRRRPGFSALLILILALCLGGNTAVFSAASAVLFRTLPFHEAERLVIVTESFIPTGELHNSASWPDVLDWQKQSTVFTDMAPFLHWSDRVLIEGDNAERVGANFVSSSYFRLLGWNAALGRTFSSEEDAAPGSVPRAIISHRLWAEHFARDPGILGQQIQLNNLRYTVIGVMPEEFRDIPNVPHLSEVADVWLPAAMASEAFGAPSFESRRARLWYVLARLKPGVTIEQARDEMNRIATELQKEHPGTNKDYGAIVHKFAEFVFEDLRPAMKALFVGGLFVLFMGCANVSNLLMVRSLERRRELSVRLALGAGRMRLVRQMLAESLVLAVLGGGLGLLLAFWGTRLLAAVLEVPEFIRIELDLRVLLTAVAVTLLVGLAFGLALALGGSRVTPRDALQQIGGSSSTDRRAYRGRNALIVLEVSVAVILLIGAGLMLQSFLRLHSTKPDFTSERMLTMRLDLATETYDDPQAIRNVDQMLLDRVRAIPGVADVAIWGPGIPGRDNQYQEIGREGAEEPEQRIRTDRHYVSPGALRVLGIPLLQGRDFTTEDTADAPRVALMSKSLADTLWPGQDPIGKRCRSSPAVPWLTVVGVFADVKLRNRLVEREHDLLLNYQQIPIRDVALLVHTRVDPASLSGTLRNVIKEIDPQIPVYDIATIEQRLYVEEAEHRLNAALMGLYAALAVVLALLGIYGVLAHSVAQRTQEIGVRVALGARRSDIFGMVVYKGLALVGFGLLLGLAGAYATTNVLSSLLYGITPTDPSTFIGTTVFFVMTALLASLIPARRAVEVEPTTALRYE